MTSRWRRNVLYLRNKSSYSLQPTAAAEHAELSGLTVLAAFRTAIRPESITDVNLPTLVNVVALETLKPCHQ